MKLLDEIIDLLSDESSSLTAALLKTKVLLHTIGHPELAEWVNKELGGYSGTAEVPSYRVVGGKVMGMVQAGLMVYKSLPLPTSHLPDKLKDYLTNHKLTEAMSVLEQMAKGEKGQTLMMQLSPEIGLQFNKALAAGCHVQDSWVEMSTLQVAHAVAQVRSRLLDFALGLKDKVGDVPDKEVKQAAEHADVAGMFKGTVIGDNATFIIGSQNTTHIKNSIKKNDWESLATLLKEKGVSDEDVNDLKGAITQDDGHVDVKAKTFGPAVKAWMTKMLGKAVDTSWQIELGVAGGLLVEALKAYYF